MTDACLDDHLLHDGPGAPSPRRLRWFLVEKGVAIPTRAVDLRAGEHLRAPWAEENPGATVPVLERPDGERIADSLAICRYVEALRPDPPLFGDTPLVIARVEAWLHRVNDQGYTQVADWLRNSKSVFADRPLPGAWAAGVPQIAALAERAATLWRRFAERLEPDLGDGWLTGERFTIADIALAVACDFADAAKMDGTAGPRLAAWRGRAAARPGASA